MYKIAHISDPHVSSDDKNGHGKKFKEILENAVENNCDHIVITGDISDTPEENDLSNMRTILDRFSLLDNNKLTVIPGNHDIFGSPPPGEDSFKFPLICKETDYDYNLKLFSTFLKETFPEPRVGEEDIIYPYLKILNDNIAMVSVNSVAKWSLEKNPESTNGEITEFDLERLKLIFASHDLENHYKIFLVHHHFNKPEWNEKLPYHSMWLAVVNHKMKLHNVENILGVFRDLEADIVLHGHTHINESYTLNGIKFLNSSACVMPLTYDKIRSYNILNIPDGSREEEGIQIETITL